MCVMAHNPCARGMGNGSSVEQETSNAAAERSHLPDRNLSGVVQQ